MTTIRKIVDQFCKQKEVEHPEGFSRMEKIKTDSFKVSDFVTKHEYIPISGDTVFRNTGLKMSNRLRLICSLPYGPISQDDVGLIVEKLNDFIDSFKFFYHPFGEKRHVVALQTFDGVINMKMFPTDRLMFNVNDFHHGTIFDRNNLIDGKSVHDARSAFITGDEMMRLGLAVRIEMGALNRGFEVIIAEVEQKEISGKMPAIANYEVFYARSTRDAAWFRNKYRDKRWKRLYDRFGNEIKL